MYAEMADAVRAQVERLIVDAFDDAKGLSVCPTASRYVPEMTAQCYDNYAALVDAEVNWCVPWLGQDGLDSEGL